MPDISRATAILRDDILAQLRIAQRPLRTTEVRERAPRIPIPGIAYPMAPIREQVYAVLRSLEREGLVTRTGSGDGRTVTWSATRGAADDEIADLEAALLGESPFPPLRLQTAATQHVKAAARAATRAAAQCSDYPHTSALSRVVIPGQDLR